MSVRYNPNKHGVAKVLVNPGDSTSTTTSMSSNIDLEVGDIFHDHEQFANFAGFGMVVGDSSINTHLGDGGSSFHHRHSPYSHYHHRGAGHFQTFSRELPPRYGRGPQKPHFSRDMTVVRLERSHRQRLPNPHNIFLNTGPFDTSGGYTAGQRPNIDEIHHSTSSHHSLHRHYSDIFESGCASTGVRKCHRYAWDDSHVHRLRASRRIHATTGSLAAKSASSSSLGAAPIRFRSKSDLPALHCDMGDFIDKKSTQWSPVIAQEHRRNAPLQSIVTRYMEVVRGNHVENNDHFHISQRNSNNYDDDNDDDKKEMSECETSIGTGNDNKQERQKPHGKNSDGDKNVLSDKGQFYNDVVQPGITRYDAGDGAEESMNADGVDFAYVSEDDATPMAATRARKGKSGEFSDFDAGSSELSPNLAFRLPSTTSDPNILCLLDEDGSADL